MARRPAHRLRLPDRPEEPAAEIPEAAATVSDAPIPEAGGEPQPGRAGPSARRRGRPATGIPSGSVASRRVAAAAAAAGAAVAGLPAGAGANGARTEATTAVSPEAACPAAEPVGEAEHGPSFRAAPASAAAAAATAVSAAIAATIAARAAHQAGTQTGGAKAADAGIDEPAALQPGAVAEPATPLTTVPGDRNLPAKDSPRIIRAHRDEPESEDSAPAALVAPPPLAADDPNRRYMRPSAAGGSDLTAVTGILLAGHDPEEESAGPAPLFSNEGLVREAEARPRRRFLGLIGGPAAALLGAGTAFGHDGGSPGAETETLLAGPEDEVVIATSPDFGQVQDPRPRSQRRKSGAMLAAATFVVALVGIAAAAAFLPVEKSPLATATPATSPLVAALDNSPQPSDSPSDPPTDEPTALPSGLVIGDDPLPPGATRKPVATSGAARTPAPAGPATTAGPSPTTYPTSTPGSTALPSPTPTPTPTPTHTPTPTPTPVPTPTPTPTPTPVPTPTPTPMMFALVYSVTPPAVAPSNGLFYVASLPGASCKLHRLPVVGDNNSRTSNSFSTDSSGWAYLLWGASWPATSTAVTATFYATCTAANPDNRTATSPNVTAIWPAKASPSPSPT